ncbi:MAG: methionine ABC transporter ATP-binding protein, partial [Beijerinckiaceae bacterium]
LKQIPGSAPSLARLPEGCAFRPRCGHETEACCQQPAATEYAGGRMARCCNPLRKLEKAA